MDILRPTAEHIALYVRFWIAFVWPPARALSEIEGSGKVQPQLIVFLGIGILVAWLIGYAAGLAGVPDDPSASFQAAKGMTYGSIPQFGLAATLVTVIVAALVHGAVRLYGLIDRERPGPARATGLLPALGSLRAHLGGNVQDTINAALGFVAFFAPLAVLILASALMLARVAASGIVVGSAGILLAALFLVYLPAALAATHRNTGYGQAFVSLAVVCVALGFLIL